MKWASAGGGPISQGIPSQAPEPPGTPAWQGQALTQIKPPQLTQQPENERPSGHCDCWQTPGVRLSVCPNFISYTPDNADRAGPFCFHFSFLSQNLPFPPS